MKPLIILSLAITTHAATPVSDIKVPPGFKVELLREAGEREGSWISMALDAEDRIYISPQGSIPESGMAKDSKWGGLWRATLNPHLSSLNWERVPVPIGDSMGMLWAFDSLYVSGNGPDGRGIYRCKDTDGDTLPDTAVMWKKIPGGAGEHGAHALILSPDKKNILIVHGNSTGIIDDISPDSPYRNWGEDDLLPKLKDPTASFFDKIAAPYGYVVRTDEHGKKWELLAGGMRNAYDIDFNAGGELFTYDSDMEWDRGLPWYRPTRVLHIVPGGEYGFREGSAKMPAYYPDTLPAVVDVGLGCPTGVKFGTRSNFGEKYRRAFFICDWTYGRILAVHIREKGASYTASNPRGSATFPKDAESSEDVEPFVVGKGMPVTDVEFLGDGSMVFTTGGRGTSAGLYRVSFGGQGKQEGLGGRASSPPSPPKTEAPTKSPTPEPQPSDSKIELTALLKSLLDSSAQQTTLLEGLKLYPLAKISDGLKLLKLRILQLTFARHGRPSEEWQKVGLEKLLAAYPAPPSASEKTAKELNRELSQLLVWLSQPELGDFAQKPNVLPEKGAKDSDRPRKDSGDLRMDFENPRKVFGKPSTENTRKSVDFTGSTEKTAPTQPILNHGAVEHKGRAGQMFHAELGQQVIEKTLALLESVPNQEDQIHYALVLRWAHGWTIPQRERYFRWFHEKGARLSGGNSLSGFIKKIHTEAVSRVPEDARLQLSPTLLAPLNTAVAAIKERPFIKAWTLADLETALDALKDRKPDAARGKQLYADAQCARCHLYKDAGGNVGPDLSAVAQRFQRRDILEAIVDPNKIVSEQYALTTLTVIKFGGGEEQVTGILQEETSGTIRILTDPLTGASREFYHNVVKKKDRAAVSLMPPALLNTLSAEEVADLLAFMGAK